ncbi:MAG: peptide-binding protein, partial [Gemmatimonadaceae bacterium]|nr:peptide-binding protein [Caulobacter sp.]
MSIIILTKKIGLKQVGMGLAMTATALTLAVAPTTASAMSQKLGGVIGCNASGGKQEVGAVIGGLLGAVAGNKLAKHD